MIQLSENITVSQIQLSEEYNGTTINYNVQSLVNVPGPQGPAGVDGTNGSDGAQGIPGNDGVDGQDGADGINGSDGQDGAQGVPGNDGADGQDLTTGDYQKPIADYTFLTSDRTVEYSSGSFRATLHTAVGHLGKEITLINIGTGTPELYGKINGIVDVAVTLPSQWDTITVTSNDEIWIITEA